MPLIYSYRITFFVLQTYSLLANPLFHFCLATSRVRTSVRCVTALRLSRSPAAGPSSAAEGRLGGIRRTRTTSCAKSCAASTRKRFQLFGGECWSRLIDNNVLLIKKYPPPHTHTFSSLAWADGGVKDVSGDVQRRQSITLYSLKVVFDQDIRT